MSIYDFTVKNLEGTEKTLADYQGKVLLIVNTATGCGFTPQYAELQEIYMMNTRRMAWRFWIFPAINLAIRHPERMRKSIPSAPVVLVLHFPSLLKSTCVGKMHIPYFSILPGIPNLKALA